MSVAPLLANDGLEPGAAPAVFGVLSEGYSPDAKKEGCGDQRVAMTPDVAKTIIKDGYTMIVEKGAGIFAGFSDEHYAVAGCQVMSRAEVMSKSQVMFAIEPPVHDFKHMGGKVLICWVGRLQDKGKAVVKQATEARVNLLDVVSVPRITIAQKLDTLSSQAKVAGHRAVVEATHAFGRFHTAEMTAAGKYPPSQTFVLGCGVAGLAAIGSSKAFGSVVRAWDVRDVSDQVHSMGAKWVSVDFKEDGAGAGGYAKESTEEFKRAQQDTFKKVLGECDIAISTAAIPGKRSPLLITKEAVAAMKPGSIIVDLAAVGGGNCELTKKDEVITTPNGVTIIGYTDLAARMANQASAMYAQNMCNLIQHTAGKKKEEKAHFLLKLYKALDDTSGDQATIVERCICCCKDGKLYDTAAPPQPTPPKPKIDPKAPKEVKKSSPLTAALTSALTLSLVVGLMLGIGEGVKTSLLTTFLLAGAAGYQAVWGVAHALHTPLMSVTNAISGMTAVGGLLLWDKVKPENTVALSLAMTAVGFSAVNIFGGFVVSQRMLNLFKKKEDKDYSFLTLLPALIFVYIGYANNQRDIEAMSVISGVLCVAAIGGLASQSTAQLGCKLGMLGMIGGLISTFTLLTTTGGDFPPQMYGLVLLAVGGIVGVAWGAKVDPMALPQTVAAFHSLVGLAAMLTSIGSGANTEIAGANVENVSAVLGDFIGGVTLTGSLVAFAKLNGTLFGRKVSSAPLNLPGKNFLNLSGLAGFIALMYFFFQDGDYMWLVYVAVLSMIMGYHLVASVGGGDMPVCITVLNSYSGWALVAEGFLLQSPLLTIVGSLIGCSGAILTKIMCDAMNRDIMNVIFGGMNVAAPAKKGDEGPKEHTETSVEAVAELLINAKEVLVVPGYGMAQARAQTAMGELASILRNNKINIKFGIHPVAGRMPGQMNVLLAEASVPHEWVLEMDEVNPSMESEDVALILGANDVVNSASQEVEGCSIWGMPVIEVWRSKKVIFCKRSMAGGYADVENPVFFKPNTDMLLGDGKKTAEALVQKVRERLDKV